jgi:hypothetical protein
MKTSSSSSLLHARQSIAGERPPRRAVFRDHLVTVDLHVDVPISSECAVIFCEVIHAETLVELLTVSRPSLAR